MSDDLVKRGREIFDRGLPEDVGLFGMEAADEIERLAVTLQSLKDVHANSQEKWGKDFAAMKQRAEAAEAELKRMESLGFHKAEGGMQKYIARAEAAEAKVRELGVALEACLKREQERAQLQGLSDCACISFSRVAENEYEAGRCPHQLARQTLSNTKDKSNG